jgi:hypothetical protein
MRIALRLHLAAGVMLFFVVAQAAPLRAADNWQAGQWEFTYVTNGKSKGTNRCVPPTEAVEANGDLKSARAAAAKRVAPACSVETYAIAGDTVNYSLICSNQSIAHTIRYHGDTSEATITTSVQGAKPLVSHVKGRRLGECTTPVETPSPSPAPSGSKVPPS